MSDLEFTRVNRSQGIYGFRLDGTDSEPEWQYSFHMPGGRSLHVTVGLEHDFDLEAYEPLEIARKLERVHSRYLLSSSLEKIRAFIPYLEAREREDYINRRKDRIDILQGEIAALQSELDYLPEHLEDTREG